MRSQALAQLDRDLQPGQVVELVGPSAVGKSALVREWVAARGVAPVWWAELAGARTPDAMIAELAAAAGIAVAGDPDPGRRLAAVLEDRPPALLVLDGLVAADLVDARWTPACPVIVIARQPLGLPRSRSLTLPPLDDEEARQRMVGLVPAWADDPVVPALVAWLDRLPAALVAVAPLAALGSAAEVLAHLQQRGRVPGMSTVLERTWEVLAPEYRRVWARLAVVPGPLDLELATVAAGTDAAPALLELVERGMVRRDGDALRMLGAASRFGGERLGDPTDVAWPVAVWLADDPLRPTVDRPVDLLGNLELATRWRRVFPWAIRAMDDARPDVVAALVLRWSPWLTRAAPSSLARDWLRRGVDAAQRGRVPIVEGALRALRTGVLQDAGDMAGLRADLARNDELADATGCRWLRAHTAIVRGRLAMADGDLDELFAQYGEAADLARAAGVKWMQAVAESALAQGRYNAGGDRERVVAEQRAALELVRDGPASVRSMVRMRLGQTLRGTGRIDEAVDVTRAAVDDAEETGAVDTVLTARTWLGIVLVAAGRAEAAREVLRTAVAQAEANGLRRRLAWLAATLGHAEQVLGDLDAARDALLRDNALARSEDIDRLAATIEHDLAMVSWECGDGEAALRHARTAHGAWPKIAAPIRDIEAALVAGILGWLGRADEAAAGWVGLADVSWSDEASRSVRLLQAFADLPRLRRAVAGRDLATAEGVRDRLLALADESHPRAPEAWVTARILRAATRTAMAGLRSPLRVSADCARIVTPDDAVVDLSRRGPTRRVLSALVRARRDAIGQCLDLDTLFEAGWPSQQASGTSGHARVYVAISTLRKLGLGEVLQTTEDGYRMDPEVALVETP